MIKTLKTFPRMYYIIVFLITSFNATMFNFISFSSPLITDLWLSNDEDPKVNEEIAGRLMGLPYICCTFLAPMIGLFVDAYG